MKTLAARPATVDYRAEIEKRFAGRALMLQMDYAGSSNSQQRRPYEMSNGIALIDICGVLSNDAYYWDETEYGDIQDEVRMAVDDPEVKGILLRVNSPGGDTENAFETARVLAEAGKQKPIWAAVEPIAFSAGYLLASTAARMYVLDITGGVGSIGVYSLHVDYSAALEKAGIKPTFITAGKGKTDGNPYEPLSADAKKKFQTEVDRLYGEFVGSVARGRSMAEATIVSLGAAVLYGARAAMGTGLADRPGDSETACKDLAASLVEQAAGTQQQAARLPAPPTQANAKETHMEGTGTTTPATAAVDVEALNKAALAQAQANAAEIQQLCKIAGKPELALGFFASGKTVAEVGTALAELMAKADQDTAIQNQVLPQNTGKGDSNILMAACDKIAARMKGGN
jgi:signal peptide peptidase SppA